MAIPYIDSKEDIRARLIDLARNRRTIFYSDLGSEVGIPARGPWKPILDEIAREETLNGRPDLTFLVINKQTGLPGQIQFEPAKPPTSDQRAFADQTLRAIFAFYSPS
jgi:hypothetical protein